MVYQQKYYCEIVDMSGVLLTAIEEDVLTLLQGRSFYGWQIAEILAAASQGSRVLQSGSLYPVLSRLEKNGWIAGCWGDSVQGARRKYYTCTEGGVAALREKKEYRKALKLWQGRDVSTGKES